MCINYTEKTPKVHYLTLNHFKSSLQEQWFKAQAMGVNSLKSILKDMYEAGGGGGVTQETNFPWRKTLISKSYRIITLLQELQMENISNIMSSTASTNREVSDIWRGAFHFPVGAPPFHHYQITTSSS